MCMFIDFRSPYLREFQHIVLFDRFIEDACQIALTRGGFIINNRKLLKLIVFSNYQVSHSITKFTLPARTEPSNV